MNIKQIGNNQTELHLNNGTVILFSYQTPVAASTADGWLRTAQHYSRTTTKHINQWLRGNARIVPRSELDALVEG